MKKVDNFDASKWLVENKITFQSRLNEGMAKEKMYEVTVTHKITKESSHVWVIATSEEEARKNVENSGMKLEDYYISSVVELYSEDLDESCLNEVEVPSNLNLTDKSNWKILYGPGGRTFQIQQIRPKTDPTAPMGDSGRENRVDLDINVSERKNQVTITGDPGNSVAFVKRIDGMFNSGASRIKPLGNTGAMETFITLDQLDQLAPGLYERD